MNFKQGIDPNQEFLFPKKPSDFLPENHLAKAIYEVVDLLDLTKIKSKYSNLGQNAYDPKMMIKILFHGYSIGIRSSRKLSGACEERFDFNYLTNGLKPSHDRISDFRKDNLEELKEAFKEIVMIGANLGLVNLGNINASIDGAKIKANASSKLTKDEEALKKALKKVEDEIKKIFEEAEKIDKEEDKKYGKENRGNELPKKLRLKESRKRAIQEAFEKLKQQKEQMKDAIKKEKNRNPTKTELKKINKKKINITDKEAKFMKERNGVIKPNYNAQISVDEKKQFILANDVTDECNDHHQLIPLVKKTRQNVKRNPKKIKADNGYYAQLEEAIKLFPEIDFYIDDRNRRKENINLEELKEKYTNIQYENLTKLLSSEGEKEYKKRMHTAEPPFGNLKHNLGYRHFLLRGLKKVKGEFSIMCCVHNLKKIGLFLKKNKINLGTALKNMKKNIENTTKISNKNIINKNQYTNLDKICTLFDYIFLNTV